jgi:hypothetical protein
MPDNNLWFRKHFRLTSLEANAVRSVDRHGLWPEVLGKMREMEWTVKPRRPIRIFIPADLDVELTRAKEITGHDKTELLLLAAAEYRRMYPLQENWKEKRLAGRSYDFRKQKGTTFRLPAEERSLLKDLGRGRDDILDRHEALIQLIPIVQEFSKKIQKPVQKAILITIPDFIKNEIDSIYEKNEKKIPMRDILLRPVLASLEENEPGLKQVQSSD